MGRETASGVSPPESPSKHCDPSVTGQYQSGPTLRLYLQLECVSVFLLRFSWFRLGIMINIMLIVSEWWQDCVLFKSIFDSFHSHALNVFFLVSAGAYVESVKYLKYKKENAPFRINQRSKDAYGRYVRFVFLYFIFYIITSCPWRSLKNERLDKTGLPSGAMLCVWATLTCTCALHAGFSTW